MPNITLFPTNDPHSYNNTITTLPINPYGTTKTLRNAFINQFSSYNNDEPELNNDQNITPSSDSFPTSCLNDSFFFETQHSYDNAITIPNIDPYGTIEAFQNISFSTSCSNDSFFFETQHSYNNIATTPNINTYGFVETFRNTFNPHNLKPSVHDEPMPNDE
ncbi:hypothetical protein C2G38_2214284 [Gigaspora rosea]|uniref:Uncharacterized protein n=1 Tax=Gigaspora rosea TaxID=44941 RepID=A0A397UB27_9GLOM|nr:hypothetical protein C2G38_2214284 [Gigaspora rosea]